MVEGIKFKSLKGEEYWRIVRKEGRGQKRGHIGWSYEQEIGI